MQKQPVRKVVCSQRTEVGCCLILSWHGPEFHANIHSGPVSGTCSVDTWPSIIMASRASECLCLALQPCICMQTRNICIRHVLKWCACSRCRAYQYVRCACSRGRAYQCVCMNIYKYIYIYTHTYVRVDPLRSLKATLYMIKTPVYIYI